MPSPREAAIADVLRRAAGLPPADAMEVHAQLGECLGLAEDQGETEPQRRARRRREVIEAMRQVAKHLDLPPDTAPTGPQFDAAAKELGLEWSQRTVRAVYETWRAAQEVFLGWSVPPTAKQRAYMRKHGGRARWREEYVEAVREWLETKPPDLKLAEYDDWAERRNAARPEELKVPKSSAVARATGLPVLRLVDVARGRKTLEGAQDEQARLLTDPERNPRGLVGAPYFTLVTRRTQEEIASEMARGNALAPVASLHRRDLWFAEHVHTWAAGKKPKDEWEPYYLRDEILGTTELAALFGYRHSTVITRCLYNEQWDWIPPPTGRVGDKWVYWEKTAVDAWWAEQPLGPREQRAKRAARIKQRRRRGEIP